MADGSILEDLTGVIVPATPETMNVFEVMANQL
jgi:hypothetical protein